MAALISIAMATFNGAAFLERQLASLAAQSLPPAELVICDDGSADGTVALVEAAAPRLPFPVRLVVNEATLGYRANFMKAAGRCRGDVIFFCDQDDVWHPGKLAAVMPWFDDPAMLMVHHNSRLFGPDGRTIREMNVDGRPGRTHSAMTVSPWEFPLGFSQAFRRELLALSDLRGDAPDFHDPALPVAHDHWIAFLAQSLGPTRYLADVLVDYRQHGANSFARDWTPVQRGILADLVHRLGNFPDFAVLAECCARYAGIMATVAERADVSAALRRAAPRAADGYAGMASLYRLRMEAYAAPGLVRRFRAWRTLLRDGYAPARAPHGWAFAPSQRGKDLLSGVVLARLRRGTPTTRHDFGLKHRSLYEASRTVVTNAAAR